METLLLVLTGVFLLVIAYLIGVKERIKLVHFYHRNRVQERDKPAFCRLVGCGNAFIGVGLLLVPGLTSLVGEPTALAVMGVCIALGGLAVLLAIRKYNRG